MSTQRSIKVKKNDVVVGNRKNLNLLEGANITLTAADDSASNEIDVTITAAALYATNGLYIVDPAGTYPTIQSAVNAVEAADGGTIAITKGTYAENVVIAKTCPMKILGYGSTIVPTGNSQILLQIAGQGNSDKEEDVIDVEGLNFAISPTAYTGCTAIEVRDANNCRIRAQVLGRSSYPFAVGLRYTDSGGSGDFSESQEAWIWTDYCTIGVHATGNGDNTNSFDMAVLNMRMNVRNSGDIGYKQDTNIAHVNDAVIRGHAWLHHGTCTGYLFDTARTNHAQYDLGFEAFNASPVARYGIRFVSVTEYYATELVWNDAENGATYYTTRVSGNPGIVYPMMRQKGHDHV